MTDKAGRMRSLLTDRTSGILTAWILFGLIYILFCIAADAREDGSELVLDEAKNRMAGENLVCQLVDETQSGDSVVGDYEAQAIKYINWTAQADPVYQEPDFDFVKDASISKSVVGLYYMYYTGSAYGFHGASKPPWRLDYATSKDGIKWDKQGTAFPADDDTWEAGRVQAPSKLIQHDGKYWMFYAGGPRKPVNICKIGCATSIDLKTWTKRPDLIVTHTNEGVNKANDPFIYKEGDVFHLFYTTYPRGKTEEVFYGTSRDLETWSEPISTGAWGEGVVLWKQRDTYYLLAVIGYSADGEEYHCFSGTSLDSFTHHGPVKINTPAFAKSAWGHGDILIENDKVSLYFQGSGDTGKSFQIGRATPQKTK